MRIARSRIFGLWLALATATPLLAQELPGTPSGQLPTPLRDLYERGFQGTPPAGAPAEAPPPIVIPIRRERPWLVLVPDINVTTGYSDNIFITPDVLGFQTKSDGLVTVSPRLRALFRLSNQLGLVADYNLNYTQFFSNGNSLQNSAVLFLGYRPSVSTHAEVGVRGGIADVSEFEDSNVREGHFFVSGNMPLNDVASAGAFGSIGVRDFPDRTHVSVNQLTLGLPPIVIPVGGTTSIERGENDTVANVGGVLSVAYAASGVVRAGYDFTNNDSNFSEIDYYSHRLSLAGVNTWTSWLGTQLAYSLISRRFKHQFSPQDNQRNDAIHDVTLTAYVAPPIRLPWWARSVTIRFDYDYLSSHSNVETGDFDRNFFSVGLELGFAPITNLHFRKWLGGEPAAGTPAPLGTP